MKKTYQNPAIKVVRIQQHLMDSTSATIGFGSSVNSASGAESRGGSVWDDDEE